jgi:hypothetical protein
MRAPLRPSAQGHSGRVWPHPSWAGPSCAGLYEPGQRRCAGRSASSHVLGHVAGFGPMAEGFIKSFFIFPDSIQISSNFRNSYLFDFFSKIHEANSIGFLNSSSIHKKYKMNSGI